MVRGLPADAKHATAAVAGRRDQVYGLHAVRTVLERRPERIVGAKVLRDAGGKLAELEHELKKHHVQIQHVHHSGVSAGHVAGLGAGTREGCSSLPIVRIGLCEGLENG